MSDEVSVSISKSGIMNYKIKRYSDHIKKNEYDKFVMGVDIGGTNTTIGIGGIKELNLKLLLSLKFKTQEIDSLIPLINESNEYVKIKYEILIDTACIGLAGVVLPSCNKVKLTNAKLTVDSNEIIKNTKLSSVHIINDFQAIGYGLNFLDENDKNDILILKENKMAKDRSTKAVIGAGTGFGKCILFYDSRINGYIPIASEGGHSDFPVYNEFERNLINFIKKEKNIENPLSYEELLSGRGIISIYEYLKDIKKYTATDYSEEIENSKDKASVISKYRKHDKLCKETFRLFVKYCGRCAKNFALETLPMGGLYIAGGISSKNQDIFEEKDFYNEFENAYQRKDMLKNIPIYLIVNYDVSLYGACYAAMHKILM